MDARFEDTCFQECSFLQDSKNELEQHQKLSTKNKEVISAKFDLLSKLLIQILSLDKQEQIQHESLTRVRKLKCERDSLASQFDKKTNECNALAKQSQDLPNDLLEKRNELHTLSKNLEQLKSEAADLVLETKQQQRNFKMALESIKMAKSYYKNFLGCHISFLQADGDNEEFLLMFNDTRPSLDPLPPNSIKFLLNGSKKKFQVLEMNPTVENFKQLALKLEKSQDVQGFLAYLRPIMQFKKQH